MKMKINLLKRGWMMLGFGLAVILTGSMAANAQNHSQRQERHDLKDHQRQERYNDGNSHQTRDHQKQEKHQLKDSQRYERQTYNNGGYYGNGGGYYPNNNGGYYPNNNGGYYPNNNGGYYPNNGGYYGNGGYYPVPHRDSRSRVKRGLHHLLGGH